jgi:glutamate racemase
MKNYPIGIMDSGLGGLTVLREIVKELPEESFVYVADSNNTPYGAKSVDEIRLLSKHLIDFLVEKEVKLIVIACNTITVTCLDRLRSDYSTIPIVGTVPVIKTAADISVNKRIGILSTTGTAQSNYQKHLIATYSNGCSVINEGTDMLVPLIEQGKINGVEITAVLKEVLVPFQKEDIDTLALGCTHFPFLLTQIQEILPGVKLLESGGAIARQVRRVLLKNDMLSSQKEEGTIAVYTTGDMHIAKSLVQNTCKRHAAVQHIQLNNDN